ncbi:MAG: DUF4276 family protein [Lewinellaceae bacterium]|nr:DUF4276 family protein [Saprospiraceae bacterium]MCB9340468.1 DUF4276 family protein [Lewinellaceae bacterium]
MANIFLIVEGPTEEEFYKKQLQAEYVRPDGSYRHFFTVRGIPNKRGFYSRAGSGGRVGYDSCVDIVKRFLREATHCELVILILDYYGLDKTFKSHLTTAHTDLAGKVAAIQQRLEKEINHPKFRFRLQVHEFEAYLFSDPAVVAGHFGKPEKAAELEAILSKFGNDPETINDDPKTKPSKRLENVFPTFKKGKLSDGIPIAQKIGIAKMRGKCSKFNEICNLFDELG